MVYAFRNGSPFLLTEDVDANRILQRAIAARSGPDRSTPIDPTTGFATMRDGRHVICL